MTRAALLAACLVVLAGCGRTGPPVPPEQVAPQAPHDLRVAVADQAIELAWTLPRRRADNARLRQLAALHVFRAEDSGTGEAKPALASRGRVAGYAEVATIRMIDPAPAVIDGERMTIADRATLTPGRRYTYVVLAEDAHGRVSVPSPRISATFIAAPAMPARVRAVAGDREVRVEWEPPAQLRDGSAPEGPLAYEVLRAASADAPMELVTTTPAGATSYVDRGVENERSYLYAVRALREAQDTLARGAPSDRVAANPVDTTPPAAPLDVVAIPSEATVRLSWRASPEPDVARYLVYRGREGGGFERVGSAVPPATTFTDRDVPAGRWRYAVSAQDRSSRANESSRSAEVTVTVP
jgi:fibronectin type 3 domain-containing protein